MKTDLPDAAGSAAEELEPELEEDPEPELEPEPEEDPVPSVDGAYELPTADTEGGGAPIGGAELARCELSQA